MRGRPRKPAGTAQHQGGGTAPGVEIGLRLITDPPAPPAGLSEKWAERWRQFWASPYAELVEWERDMNALERMFQMQDECDGIRTAIGKKRTVPGAAGQPVLNPLIRDLRSLEAEIRQLEDRFGLSPRASQNMGVKRSKQSTIQQLNQGANDAKSAKRKADPRLKIG